jgi:hypothetical protein
MGFDHFIPYSYWVFIFLYLYRGARDYVIATTSVTDQIREEVCMSYVVCSMYIHIQHTIIDTIIHHILNNYIYI